RKVGCVLLAETDGLARGIRAPVALVNAATRNVAPTDPRLGAGFRDAQWENGIALERIGPRELACVDRRLAREARGVDDKIGPNFAQKFAENGGIGVVVRRTRGSLDRQSFRLQVGGEATADIAIGAQE